MLLSNILESFDEKANFMLIFYILNPNVNVLTEISYKNMKQTLSNEYKIALILKPK